MTARDAREESAVTSGPPSLRLIGGRNGRGMSTIDMSIVQRAKRGDRAAFAALVDFYYARSLRFAVHMLGNGQDAEEAVQDTFVRVHGALHRYDEFDRFESWLFRILANRCRTMMGREARRSRVLVYGDLTQDRGTPPMWTRSHGVRRSRQRWPHSRPRSGKPSCCVTWKVSNTRKWDELRAPAYRR